jgi:Fe-S-cluster-containing dehydrogenase component
MDVCPVNAISKDSDTGIVKIDGGVCTGCGACVNACYYGAVKIDPDKNTAIKCDLCGGDPKCVKVCTFSGAIRYVKGGRVEMLRERQSADKSAKAYLMNVITEEV